MAQHDVFSAYRKDAPRRSRELLGAAGAAVALLVVIWLLKPNPAQLPVVTPYGIKTLELGMSQRDVSAVFRAPPLIKTHKDGRDCYRYGAPTLERPVVTLVETCFENGKLVSTSEKRYEVGKLDLPERETQEAPH